MAVTLEQYKHELEQLTHDVFISVAKLGEALVRASKDLSHADYQQLYSFLRTWWTDADLRAAEAVGKGELDARLFPHGTRNSKVMSLSGTDQERLLSGERFGVWNNFGGEDERTWAEMTPDQRNRLLGNKGGHIHTLNEQARPGGTSAKVTVYDSASFHDGRLLLNGGKNRGEIDAGTLVATMPAAELSQFIEAISA
jgi:hypothetical protein